MTAIVILVLLLAIALAAPLFGSDSRSSKHFMPANADRRLWDNTFLPSVARDEVVGRNSVLRADR
jgi:hypothetical protein